MNQLKKYLLLSFTLLAVMLLQLPLQAQKLTYQPKNPAFGGNYLNYSWMLSSANSQNSFTSQETSPAWGDDPNALDDFRESVNRQLLSQLSREIFSSQFGEDFLLQEGSFQYGDFQVEIQPGAEGLLISIFDLGTGGSTSLTIPYY